MSGPTAPEQTEPAARPALAVSAADGLVLGGAAVAAIGFGMWFLPLAFVAIGLGMVAVGLRAARRER